MHNGRMCRQSCKMSTDWLDWDWNYLTFSCDCLAMGSVLIARRPTQKKGDSETEFVVCAWQKTKELQKKIHKGISNSNGSCTDLEMLYFHASSGHILLSLNAMNTFTWAWKPIHPELSKGITIKMCGNSSAPFGTNNHWAKNTFVNLACWENI